MPTTLAFVLDDSNVLEHRPVEYPMSFASGDTIIVTGAASRAGAAVVVTAATLEITDADGAVSATVTGVVSGGGSETVTFTLGSPDTDLDTGRHDYRITVTDATGPRTTHAGTLHVL